MNIHTIRMGLTHCYIIQDKECIMVDSGPPNKLNNFTKSMQKAGIEPKKIKLIIHTHGHLDHTGSAKDIKKTTGAQIAMHESDKEWLEESLNQTLTGVTTWGHILAQLAARYNPPVIPSTKVDIILGDEEFSLIPFGISGKVLYTPGHTMGSVSVLLETGDAFVGDLAMNGFPFRLRPGLTIFAEDLELVKKSWRLLLDQGAKVVYPGHGKPFKSDTLRRAIL